MKAHGVDDFKATKTKSDGASKQDKNTGKKLMLQQLVAYPYPN